MLYFDLSFSARRFRKLAGAAALLFLAFFRFELISAEPSATPREGAGLTLREFLQRVLEHNENVQSQLLQVEIARKGVKAERGIFEPEFVASYERQDNARPNTIEQQRNLGASVFSAPTTEFTERNDVYSGGIESFLPTGGRVRLGYSLRDLANNLQAQATGVSRGTTNGEYVTFVGLSMTQPLLKGAGYAATMANLRMAAANSDLAFQEYRKQLMQTVSSAEAAYWDLYAAQEQLRFYEESVSVAQTLLSDNRARVQVGKASDLDVQEAEAGLALRQAGLNEAQQRVLESANRLITLYSGTVITTNAAIRAAESPAQRQPSLSYFQGYQEAFELNPDYLTRRKRVSIENVRLAYTKNQRYPQLDLKASYGLNGLGDTPGTSWEDVQRGNFPAWSIGVEMRFPLGGGIKAREEHQAARLRQKQSLLLLKEVETQLANALDSAIQKVQSASRSVTNYQTVVGFNQSLLDAQLKRLEVGKVDSQKVLQTEEKLLEAKTNVVYRLVEYERSLLEWELIKGSLLKNRGLDLTKGQLEAKTSQILYQGKLTDQSYESFLREVKAEFLQGQPKPNPEALEKALQILREKMQAMDHEESESAHRPPIDHETALQILRGKMKELENAPSQNPPAKPK